MSRSVVIKKAHFNNNDKKLKNIEKEIGTPIEIRVQNYPYINKYQHV